MMERSEAKLNGTEDSKDNACGEGRIVGSFKIGLSCAL